MPRQVKTLPNGLLNQIESKLDNVLPAAIVEDALQVFFAKKPSFTSPDLSIIIKALLATNKWKQIDNIIADIDAEPWV